MDLGDALGDARCHGLGSGADTCISDEQFSLSLKQKMQFHYIFLRKRRFAQICFEVKSGKQTWQAA